MPLEFSSCLLLPTIGALLLSFEGEVRSIVRVLGLQGSRAPRDTLFCRRESTASCSLAAGVSQQSVPRGLRRARSWDLRHGIKRKKSHPLAVDADISLSDREDGRTGREKQPLKNAPYTPRYLGRCSTVLSCNDARDRQRGTEVR